MIHRSWFLLGQVGHVTGAADVQTIRNPLPRHRRLPAQQPRQFHLPGIALGARLQLRLAPTEEQPAIRQEILSCGDKSRRQKLPCWPGDLLPKAGWSEIFLRDFSGFARFPARDIMVASSLATLLLCSSIMSVWLNSMGMVSTAGAGGGSVRAGCGPVGGIHLHAESKPRVMKGGEVR